MTVKKPELPAGWRWDIKPDPKVTMAYAFDVRVIGPSPFGGEQKSQPLKVVIQHDDPDEVIDREFGRVFQEFLEAVNKPRTPQVTRIKQILEED
jgi:hypothetical protein